MKLSKYISLNKIDTSLETYEFIDKGISELDCLDVFVNAKDINLNHNNISCLPRIINLPSLKSVSLCFNYLTEVSSIFNVTSLTSLYVDNNQIADLSGISKLTLLESLSLDGNPIEDLHEIKTLVNLENLYLNELAPNVKIPNLKKLPNLYELQIDKNFYNQFIDGSRLEEVIESINLQNRKRILSSLFSK